jgi:N utilization substance protein B|tara:strand:- start:65 stop:487 length:423 start_codon:yes stop_codon:yes gene_type:complete
MSDIKSYQRLLAVQALYESTINKKGVNDSFDELILHIVKNSDFKNKINSSKLLLTKEIFQGVFSNLKEIDLILRSSLNNKSKAQSFDKLLLSIFRCAIYEIEVKKQISKKIVISEYLLISNHFFGIKEATLLNGVLDNLR